MVVIEDFCADRRGDDLRQLSSFAMGGAVSSLDLDVLAARCAADGEAEVAGRYLCPSEFAQWRGFRLPKRRLEWLGGRIAAKDAAMRLQGVAASRRDWHQWQLAVLPSGRPELVAGVTPLPEISISHSGGRAMSMAMANRCGIDIQQCRAAVVRVRARFCSPSEAARLAAGLGGMSKEARLTLLWAAKEAIRKAVPVVPLPAFEEMELEAVRGEAAGVMIFACCFRRRQICLPLAVGVVLDRDFAVALVAMPTGNQWGGK